MAELAASGHTNREVAALLFISAKTVEANLARVYRKLGIHSRAELGRTIAQASSKAIPHGTRNSPRPPGSFDPEGDSGIDLVNVRLRLVPNRCE